jgi:hypothetical protein
VLSRAARITFGLGHAVTAAVVFVGVFVALPSRWWPVDTAAGVALLLHAASAVGLLRGARWAPLFARATCAFALALGLFLVTVLSVTAAWLSGVYGPVGRGGSIILALVAALALPYLVVLPVVELFWLRPAPRSARGGP